MSLSLLLLILEFLLSHLLILLISVHNLLLLVLVNEGVLKHQIGSILGGRILAIDSLAVSIRIVSSLHLGDVESKELLDHKSFGRLSRIRNAEY